MIVSIKCTVNLSQILHGVTVMYAELGAHTSSEAVSPPTIDASVQYTLLVYNQNTAKQRTLDPAGMASLISIGYYIAFVHIRHTW